MARPANDDTDDNDDDDDINDNEFLVLTVACYIRPFMYFPLLY
jgi:hypothetical protein